LQARATEPAVDHRSEARSCSTATITNPDAPDVTVLIDDRASGYQAGDLRGMISVRVRP
jgi:hypothetical protein